MSDTWATSNSLPRPWLQQQQQGPSEMLQCYKRFGKELAIRRWNYICSRNGQDHLNKLFQSEVSSLASKLYREKSIGRRIMPSRTAKRRRLANIVEAVYKYPVEISLITLMAKDVDLSAVDERGNMAAAYIMDVFLGDSVSYQIHHNMLFGVDLSPEDLCDQQILKLLYLLLNERVLNSEYKWGYSYFSVFVLLGWWNVVRWALDAGADVSDNGVCQFLPIDAVFAFNNLGQIPDDIFASLLHPTTIHHRIIPWSDPAVPDTEKPMPLHKLVDIHYQPGLIDILLKAGASIDIRNHKQALPMDVYASHPSRIFEDLDEFRQLVPKQGISPSHFLQLLNSYWKNNSQQVRSDVGEFVISILYEHITLSSEWHDLTMCQEQNSSGTNTRDLFTLSTGGQPLSTMCVCTTISILDLFTLCGIRARHMPAFQPIPNANVQNTACQQRFNELKNKWEEYRTFVPLLSDHCVRVIRSCLQTASDERVKMLPLPKMLKNDVSLMHVVDDWYTDVFLNCCKHQNT